MQQTRENSVGRFADEPEADAELETDAEVRGGEAQGAGIRLIAEAACSQSVGFRIPIACTYEKRP